LLDTVKGNVGDENRRPLIFSISLSGPRSGLINTLTH